MGDAPLVSSAPLSRVQRCVYATLRLLLLGIAKIYFRVEIVGTANLPPSGGYVLAPAHRSNLDTPLLALTTSRPLRFMGKDSLWKAGRFWAWFLTALGGFPVARGTADRRSLRAALEVVERGEPLVMFPEGTRQSGPRIQPLYDGPAFVAARAEVPIVPVGVGGSEPAMPKGAKIPRPVKIVFVVGQPLLPPAREPGDRVARRVVRELTEELHDRVQDLFEQAQTRAGA